mmetsp:Transcript_21560/g.45477  ORF Transcript_21560/g.45477 Transcript_21560/m.45477 type:complete len:93 (-) Transcript_21560:98-376(-)
MRLDNQSINNIFLWSITIDWQANFFLVATYRPPSTKSSVLVLRLKLIAPVVTLKHSINNLNSTLERDDYQHLRLSRFFQNLILIHRKEKVLP